MTLRKGSSDERRRSVANMGANHPALDRHRSRRFLDNAGALRKRMAAERRSREEKARARRQKTGAGQYPSQFEPYSEATYTGTMAIRGTDRWYTALCRRLAVLHDTEVTALLENPRTVVEIIRDYEGCFQKGIATAVEDYLASLAERPHRG